MGYTTDFEGSLQLSRRLTDKEKDYINLISSTRRMKRDVNKLMELYKGNCGNPFATEQTREAIYGVDGEYFANEDGQNGQSRDESIVDRNTSPGIKPYGSDDDFNKSWNERQKAIEEGKCQPGLWCQWIVEDDEEQVTGHQLVWDGGEKFYEYVAWLKYYIKHFFEPWGVKLNGEITWEGEDSEDLGKLVVMDNVVEEKKGTITYE